MVLYYSFAQGIFNANGSLFLTLKKKDILFFLMMARTIHMIALTTKI